MCNYSSLDPPPNDIFSPQTYMELGGRGFKFLCWNNERYNCMQIYPITLIGVLLFWVIPFHTRKYNTIEGPKILEMLQSPRIVLGLPIYLLEAYLWN